MFVFISDIFVNECRIECKNSNDFSIGLWKGLVIFLFENTCGMWRRQRRTIMISVMCTLPMVYMCKLKYSGKMIKSYRFSMTPVNTLLKVSISLIIPLQFACKSDSVLHDFFSLFSFCIICTMSWMCALCFNSAFWVLYNLVPEFTPWEFVCSRY